jgi:hypothetical protein
MLYYKMNMIMLLILALVLCAYFWPGCPKMLKDNKQMLLGVVVGLVLCSFFKKYLIEGHFVKGDDDHNQRDRQQAAAADTMTTWDRVQAPSSSPPCTGFFCPSDTSGTSGTSGH